MELQFDSFTLKMINELDYELRSDKNAYPYQREISFAGKFVPSSRHGLICRASDGTEHSCILLGGGGATGVHQHSLVVVNDSCFVALGDRLCSVSLPSLGLNWDIQVDPATCFGIFYCPQHECLLSHGELEIARVSLRGQVEWSTGGRDIFTEGFRVAGDHVEAIDFNRHKYRIEISTGKSELI